MNENEGIKLYKIVFWPILVLVISFLVIVLITSQIHRIQNQKNLQKEIYATITFEENYLANEVVLGEYAAINMRLKAIVNDLAATHRDAIVCLSIKPIYGVISNAPIIYCSDAKFQTKFEANINSLKKVNTVKFTISGEDIALVEYQSLIVPSIITSLPAELLAAILISALITFVVFYFLVKKFKKNVITPFRQTIEEKAKIMATAEIAQQVAHDIKGPLATINSLSTSLLTLPEEERLLIKNAIQRISDIANGLLSKYDECLVFSNLQNQPELISELLKRLVSEKRIQYLNSTVAINLEIAEDSHCSFANIVPTTFKQAISNLIDNAVEAVIEQDQEKIVTVKLSKTTENYLIAINDNGYGIEQQMVSRILKGGTTSKKNGHGMGLATAKKTIELCKGTLTLISQKNLGTTVNISLPKSACASWFIDSITIYRNSSIFILDDDANVHHIFDEYFKSQGVAENNIIVRHLYHSNEFVRILSEHQNEKILFLIDHELVGSKENGLDLIEKMGIAENSILITNQYDYEDIRKRAKALAIKIIPKDYIPYIVVKII